MTNRSDATGRATSLVLGIDGGGSRCTAVLAEPRSEGLRELGRGHGGPANAVAAGFDAAAANVAAAIASAFSTAGRPEQPVAAACLGFAGAGRADIRERWEAWAHSRDLAGRIEVMPDGVPAFGAAGPPAWGLVAVSGTGSIVWGRGQRGPLERCGGRGGLIGDEGSGYAIAVAALRSALRAADGWGPATAVTAAALARFAAREPNDLPAAVAAAERRAIAAFAPEVIALAEAGDPEAHRILAAAAADLGRQSLAVARRLGFAAGEYPLRVSGGLLCHSALLRDSLVEWLTAAHLPPASVTIVSDLALAAASAAAADAP